MPVDIHAVELKCVNCSSTQKTDGSALRVCSGCKSTHYCSRDCQKANWKQHKKTCRSTDPNANSPNQGANSGFRSSKPAIESLLGLSGKTYLHNRPESEVYNLLIDSYRLRIDDEYSFRGDLADFYTGGDPVPGFNKFLSKAEKRTGVLPPWRDAAKRKECVEVGSRKDHWSSLHFAVEKPDIQEHYGNSMMPMQLRLVAEEIVGSNVMAH